MTEHPALMLQRLLEEKHNLILDNERLRQALIIIHEITQETKNLPCWQALQNIEATASTALRDRPC